MSRLDIIIDRNQWRKDKALAGGQKSYEHYSHFPLKIRNVILRGNVAKSLNFQKNLKAIQQLNIGENLD